MNGKISLVNQKDPPHPFILFQRWAFPYIIPLIFDLWGTESLVDGTLTKVP